MTIVLTWHGFLNADDLLNLELLNLPFKQLTHSIDVEVVTMPVKCYLWTNQNATLRSRLHKRQYDWRLSQLVITELQVSCVCDSWNFFTYVCLFFREFEQHLMALFSYCIWYWDRPLNKKKKNWDICILKCDRFQLGFVFSGGGK